MHSSLHSRQSLAQSQERVGGGVQEGYRLHMGVCTCCPTEGGVLTPGAISTCSLSAGFRLLMPLGVPRAEEPNSNFRFSGTLACEFDWTACSGLACEGETGGTVELLLAQGFALLGSGCRWPLQKVCGPAMPTPLAPDALSRRRRPICHILRVTQ